MKGRSMRYVNSIVGILVAIFWIWIARTYEPFKSNYWLAVLGAGIFSVLVYLAYYGVVLFQRRSKSDGQNN